jgi:hypothetical protein
VKKYLPLILIGLGLIILLVIVYFVAKNMNKSGSTSDNVQAPVSILPESQWPVVTLTPTNKAGVSGSEGHWLDFNVKKINVPGATTMDYLLVYNTSDGGQQGVPGTVALTGADIDRPLLLGSESSGKFRYDAGVEQGTMTITFRGSNGKSIGKLSTDFHLQSGTTTLISIDGNFTYTLDKVAKGIFFVTMKTFLQPEASVYVAWQAGYGVFSSDAKPHAGKVTQ